MLNKDVLIGIFQKLYEEAKKSYDEFNAADWKNWRWRSWYYYFKWF